jgi:hypothetical protein
MPLSGDPVTVLPEQREVLEQLAQTHSTSQQLAMRARLILCAADGVAVRENARELGVWPKAVRYWRRRWRQAADGSPCLIGWKVWHIGLQHYTFDAHPGGR